MTLLPRLQLTGSTKAYPGMLANSDVSLTLQDGEIHARWMKTAPPNLTRAA